MWPERFLLPSSPRFAGRRGQALAAVYKVCVCVCVCVYVCICIICRYIYICKRDLPVCCLSFGSRFLSGHAALTASDTNACMRTCTIMTYDLCRYLYARASACTATMSYVGHHASYDRVQTALKVRVCVAVLRETYLHGCPRVQKFTP